MAEYVIDLSGVEVKTIKEAHGIETIEALWGLPVRERIVRCRDCRHSSVSFDETRTMCRYWSMNSYDDSESSHGYTLYPVVKPDGFCAWGERRADG